jgi:hypothetical protein
VLLVLRLPISPALRGDVMFNLDLEIVVLMESCKYLKLDKFIVPEI